MVATVKKRHLALLRPYLVGEEPRGDGEWDMFCPLHEDAKRSAGINVKEGVWFCHAGCGGGRIASLIRRRSEWVPPTAAARNGSAPRRTKGQPQEEVSEARVQGWMSSLMSNEEALEALMDERGLELETLERFEIGWDSTAKAYTIPIRSPEGEVWNVRRYQLHPTGDRRKIWSIKGMGSPRLYPIDQLNANPRSIIVCEGELDALLTIQNGYPAVTRTGAADVWRDEWNGYFKGRIVYVCHDADKKGQAGNRRVAKALDSFARDVRTLELPFKVEPKHGKDLTDFWLEHDREEFRAILRAAQGREEPAPVSTDPADAKVLDSFDAKRVGQSMKLTVTVKGKRDPGYSIPRLAKYECTQDAGDKCNVCPMNAANGEDEVEVESKHPIVLQMLEATSGQVGEALRRYYGAEKCTKLEITVKEHQSVEVLFARPSVEHVRSSGVEDFKNVKLTSIGRHDTQPNNTVEVIGALHPDPRKQLNEFLAWDVRKMETSLDNFELTPAIAKRLLKFRPAQGQRPLRKLVEIARDLETHATKIYGRLEMHVAMDLVWHSALSFDFARQRIDRGWIQLIVVGDTRTGKSEVATQLLRHYGAGEMVGCESASYAGIVGGLQQFGSGKEWAITWGTIPLNDRRLVVLDEISGLQVEDISKMSDVRSRGVAQLTKIQQEQTLARTRLICLGNPRGGRMLDYTYGVQALRPLIGTNEDIARFDLAMSVAAGEVSPAEINRTHGTGEQRYGAEECGELVRWAWSRKPEQVKWAQGSQEAVYKYANDMGSRYIEDPPLVQTADVRIKIARVSVAIAARVFSTDRSHESILVKPEHVRDAVAFMDRMYALTGFGYAERSREMIKDRSEAESKRDIVKAYLVQRPGLAKFLRNTGKFRRQDLEETLHLDRETVNKTIHHLWSARMVRRDKGDIRIEPTLHSLLREIKL